jgi:hypothetical protein
MAALPQQRPYHARIETLGDDFRRNRDRIVSWRAVQMPKKPSLKSVLRVKRKGWWLGDPVPAKKIAAATRRKLPAAIVELYRLGSGGNWGDDVAVYPFTHFCSLLEDRILHQRLPSAVYFASDGGSGLFLVDADGSLDAGAGAVHRVGMGSCAPEDCQLCAPSLAEFAAALARGELPWKDAPRLGGQRADKFVTRLRARDGWEPGPAPAEYALDKASFKLNIGFPDLYERLLRSVDGARFVRAGIVLRTIAKIEKAKGAPSSTKVNPGALLIADGADGARYAIATMAWSPEHEGRVLRLARRISPAKGEWLGPFSEVVFRWLDGQR